MKRYSYVTHDGTKGAIEADGDLAALEQLNDQLGIGSYSLQVISGDPLTVGERMIVNQRQPGGMSKHVDFWDEVHRRSQRYQHG